MPYVLGEVPVAAVVHEPRHVAVGLGVHNESLPDSRQQSVTATFVQTEGGNNVGTRRNRKKNNQKHKTIYIKGGKIRPSHYSQNQKNRRYLTTPAAETAKQTQKIVGE